MYVLVYFEIALLNKRLVLVQAVLVVLALGLEMIGDSTFMSLELLLNLIRVVSLFKHYNLVVNMYLNIAQIVDYGFIWIC